MEIRKFRPEPPTTKKVENQTKSVITPSALDSETISILTDRIKDEYAAHYYYRAAANWCRNKNYKKAALYFESEANSELEHAKGLQEYMDDFNVMPQIPETETEHDFENLVEIINGSYQMELNLMKAYNQSSSQLFTSDLTTFDFLKEYRETQKQAVIEYSDLLNALILVDYNDKFQLLYFEQTYF